MNAKKLQAKASTLYEIKVDVYKGHTMNGQYGWIMRPFASNEIYLGKNLKEAHAEIDNKIEFRAE